MQVTEEHTIQIIIIILTCMSQNHIKIFTSFIDDSCQASLIRAALAAAHSFTQGNPRLIDNLMTDALTIGFQQERKVIDAETIGLQSKTRDFTEEVFKVHFKGYDFQGHSLVSKAILPLKQGYDNGRHAGRKVRLVPAQHDRVGES